MERILSITDRVAPWRFLLFFVILVGSLAEVLTLLEWRRAVLAAFDISALIFMVSCVSMLRYSAKELRRLAKRNDANRVILLVLSFLLSLIIFAAVIALLSEGKQLQPVDKILIAVSLAMIWLFANTVYTLHYANLFYTGDDGGKDRSGLIFPGTKEPIMSDFVYFSFTLGVAVQTSDVQVTSCHIRNVVTAHCVAGFFFNLGVLALTINVLGGG